MVVHNLSYKTFQTPAPYITDVSRYNEEGKEKGSLTMFEEWLNINIHTHENLRELIIKPLRNIRSIRQKPAHELTSNEYDVTLFRKQINLMKDTYAAIRNIRLFFANHPLTKGVKVPEYLVSGNDIVEY